MGHAAPLPLRGAPSRGFASRALYAKQRKNKLTRTAMPKLDLDTIPQTNTTGYPAPYDAPVQGRWYRRLAPATGLSDFAASHVVLKPGAWSSQRHWHDGEDEMLVMISGEAVLVERSEEHTSELQSLMRISYAVFCLKKKKNLEKN